MESFLAPLYGSRVLLEACSAFSRFGFILIIFFMVLKALYWNYRGAGSTRSYSIINDMINLQKLDLLVLAEQKISGAKAEEAIKKINMKCLERLEAEGRSGGLWVFARNNSFKFKVIKVGFNYIHLSIEGGDISEMLFTAVYVFLQATRKKQCFDNIKDLARTVNKAWIIMGDFNEIMNEEEKKRRGPFRP